MKLGGIHDYVGRLKEIEIINYIQDCAEKVPELKENNLLDELSKKRGYSQQDLKALLDNFDRESLIRIAITADEYDRESSSQPRVGGISDSINSLSLNQIKNFILKKAYFHPELRKEGYFRKFLNRYEAVKPNPALSGLADTLNSFERKELEKNCLCLLNLP